MKTFSFLGFAALVFSLASCSGASPSPASGLAGAGADFPADFPADDSALAAPALTVGGFCVTAPNGNCYQIEVESGDYGSGATMNAGSWTQFRIREGVNYSETDAAPKPNPFLDRRMTLLIWEVGGAPGQWIYHVPGFFAGDGAGGGTGDVWAANFVWPKSGVFGVGVSFRQGTNVALVPYKDNPVAGTPLAFDRLIGHVAVAGVNPNAPGFFKDGRLEHVGKHYMRFRNSGRYFLKGGTDSPENLFAYAGFDNTQDVGGIISGFLHYFSNHGPDDDGSGPFWVAESGVNSRGLIGALNYLAKQQVNSIYFLPMNLGGDGQDTHPFVDEAKSAFNKTHYDLSKMRQWELAMRYAQERGILLHLVLSETEFDNEQWLDAGGFGTERQLFFRELMARFGTQFPAVMWNLGEECDFTKASLRAQAAYLRKQDPYPTGLRGWHTHYDQIPYGGSDSVYGESDFTVASIQGNANKINQHLESVWAASEAAGHPWMLGMDETGDYVCQPGKEVDYRKKVLWSVFLNGGHQEAYFGYLSNPLPGGDVNCEEFHSRETFWKYTWYARKFLEENAPFWEMKPMDALLAGEGTHFDGSGNSWTGQVFAKPGEVYAIYLPNSSPSGQLDLSGVSGSFTLRWYDPRNGVFAGAPKTISGGAIVSLGNPPSLVGEDWAVLIEKN